MNQRCRARVYGMAVVASALAASVAVLAPRADAQAPPTWLDPYRETAERLIAEATRSDFAWSRLAELTDTFGSRLSGSEGLARAIDWAVAQMTADGLERVRREPVMVPRWVRGRESLALVEPVTQPLAMLGLGGSVGTPAEGLVAEALVVSSFTELEASAPRVRGRIVVFNVPFTNYGQTVVYRTTGASAAARHGAVASLVRSVGPEGLRTPHTGGMQYADDAPRIPAAAISAEDAARLQRLQARGERILLRLHMEATLEADVESANVVAELTGRERPHEVVLLGGHFDSWDVGTGASDDGVGCIVTWEAVRLLRALNISPRRTIRLVLWTNEENGLRGAIAYRDAYAREARNHVFALESDSGVFEPMRLGFSGPETARVTVSAIARELLSPLGLDQVGPGGGGADIGPIVRAGQVPAMSLNGDPTRYFTVHHTPADTVERIAPREVSKAAAAIAVLVYVVAELPHRLDDPGTGAAGM